MPSPRSSSKSESSALLRDNKSSTSSDVDPYATDTALDLGFLRLSTLGSKKGSSISQMHLA